MNEADLDRAIARIPRWIVILGLLGTLFAGRTRGAPYAGAFLVGAAAAWFNFRLIERAVDRLGRLASAQSARRPPGGPACGCLSSFLSSFWGPLLYSNIPDSIWLPLFVGSSCARPPRSSKSSTNY